MSSSLDRSKATGRKTDVPVSNDPRETNSIIFEWPLRGLKQMFDSSKVDAKSKVIKSTPFGGGRWTVLFYAQSGHEQFCSLYLNAEPLVHERMHPLLATTAPTSDLALREGGQAGSGKSKGENGLEEKWQRKGLFRFTFNIQTIEDRSVLGTKEAHDHAFSHKTSNWGWAQFAKRDHVYYKNPEVVREDGFLITVTITSSPERPKMAEPVSHIVPPVLVQAMGSLLDDPEHSDVVFHLHPSRRRVRAGRTQPHKVYAIRKILAARSEYFRLMFEGGFQEAEAEESSEEDGHWNDVRAKDTDRPNAPAHPSRSHHVAARASESSFHKGGDARQAYEDSTLDGGDLSADDEEDDEYEPEAFFEDSDEDFDDLDDYADGSPYSAHVQTPADSNRRDYLDSGNNSPNEDVATGGSYGAEMSDEEEGEAAADAMNRLSVGSKVSKEDEEEDLAGRSAPQGLREGISGNDSNISLASARQSASDSANAPLTAPTRDSLSKKSRSRHSTRTSANGDPLLSTTRESVRAPSYPSSERGRRKRRKVNVLDSAYPTFKALLFFLYTDTVEFAPLTSSFLPIDIAASADEIGKHGAGGSSGMFNGPPMGSTSSSTIGPSGSVGDRRNRDALGSIAKEMAKAHRKRKQVIEAYCERNPDKPSPCSAKAMYRLADKLDIPDLKRRAQEHIQMSLTVHNIVWEVFSGFNTQYPDIRRMETDFLLKHWPQVKRSSAMKSIFLRSSAHPGLAEVWPHLLEYLEYRQPDVDDTEDAITY